MSMVTTDIDVGSVIFTPGHFADELLTLGAGVTVLEGTLLARDSVSLKLVPFAVGGAQGSGVPVAVITYQVSSVGAGDVPIRAMISGTVKAPRLVIHVDGDASNITAAILDSLRDIALVPIDVQQLGIYS